jgi:hypothetical protein
MPKPSLEETIAKVQKFGRILKSEVAHERMMTKQEEKAIHEAIRLQSMHRDKFAKEQKKHKNKEKKHLL